MMIKMGEGRVHIGTSGWSYNHWRGLFYPSHLPSRKWFSYYREHFRTVELNNTFYRLPSPQTFQAWRRQAAGGFIYAVKASRFITHIKRLRQPEDALPKFLERARLLGETLGPILYQLPPRWQLDLPRLEEFIAALPRDLTHVFEFRDPRWLCEPVFHLLEENALGFCIVSLPQFPCPLRATSKVAYIRLHGSRLLYGSRYSREELREWAGYITSFLKEGRDVYVYFNNDAFANAVENAKELRYLVEGVMLKGEEGL